LVKDLVEKIFECLLPKQHLLSEFGWNGQI